MSILEEQNIFENRKKNESAFAKSFPVSLKDESSTINDFTSKQSYQEDAVDLTSLEVPKNGIINDSEFKEKTSKTEG